MSRIAALMLIAWCGLSCSADSRRSTDSLAPQQLTLSPVYAGLSKRFRLDFTVDGKQLTGATYTIGDVPHSLGVVEVIPETPLGGGTWVEVSSTGVIGAYRGSLQISSPQGDWTVPLVIVVQQIPSCSTPDDCHFATFDPTEQQCVLTALPDGALCRQADLSCLRQSSCRQAICVTVDIEEHPPECTQNHTGAALTPAWKYLSDGTIVFTGTTDNEGAIYFLDCRPPQAGSGDRCDLVSLDTNGNERWRIVDMLTQAPTLDTPRLMVIGSSVVLTVESSLKGRTWLRIVDRVTGAVRRSEDGQWLSLSAVRISPGQIAITQGVNVRKMVVDEGIEFSAPPPLMEIIASNVMSDGAGRLVGLSSEFLPVFMEPPIPALHLFGTTLTQSNDWVLEVSRNAVPFPLATFEDRLLTTTPDVRKLSTGELIGHAGDTAQLHDAVLTPGHGAVAVTDRGINGCPERLLHQLNVETSAFGWRCHLSSPASGSRGVSRLIALDNAGVILAVETIGPTENAGLLIVDASGSQLLYRQLPLKLDFESDITPTIVGSRWIVSGVDTVASRRAIVAFDVPDIRPATSGWITAGGRLTRDWTPIED